MFDDQPMPMTECKSAGGELFRVPSILDGLNNRKAGLESNLREINEAIEALEKNPEIATVIEKIAKVRRL